MDRIAELRAQIYDALTTPERHLEAIDLYEQLMMINPDQCLPLQQQRDMARLSKHFKSFYDPLDKTKDAEFSANTHLIRYEDLAIDPVAQCPGLREFTGLDIHLSDQPQTDSVSQLILRTKLPAWRTENFSRSLNPSSIGQHRTILSRMEIQEIEKHCRDFLTAFGYI